jgi:hypothetical protein
MYRRQRHPGAFGVRAFRQLANFLFFTPPMAWHAPTGHRTQAAEAVSTAWDKAVLAYDIAVAALVLACVLSLAALAVAVWALRKVRAVEGAASSGGGCFTPAAAKYEKHTDVAHPHPPAAGAAATTAVEMGAYDKI